MLADKILVSGSEWVEDTGTSSCNLWFQLTVKVSRGPTAGGVATAMSAGC